MPDDLAWLVEDVREELDEEHKHVNWEARQLVLDEDFELEPPDAIVILVGPHQYAVIFCDEGFRTNALVHKRRGHGLPVARLRVPWRHRMAAWCRWLWAWFDGVLP